MELHQHHSSVHNYTVSSTPKHCCPICGQQDLSTLIKWDSVPIFVNVAANTKQQAMQAESGKLTLVQCQHCGFVFNQDFNPDKVRYSENYHAEHRNSQAFAKHTNEVINFIFECINHSVQNVLEVGCGKGEFLQQFIQTYKLQRLTANQHTCFCGIDPSVPPLHTDGLTLEAKIFNESYVHELKQNIDLLINRHLIEHIYQPDLILQLFNQSMSPNGLLYLETPRLDWILQNGTFFDFCYEHCNYFSDSFMQRLLEASGFEIIKVNHSFQAQHFSICARKAQLKLKLNNSSNVAVNPKQPHSDTCCSTADQAKASALISDITPATSYELEDTQAKFEQLNQLYHKYLDCYHPQIDDCVWGCSCKGVNWLNLLDPHGLCMAVDINPYKQNHFVLHTGHRIMSPEELKQHPPKRIFVMNAVYMNEIYSLVQQLLPHNDIEFYAAESYIKELK